MGAFWGIVVRYAVKLAVYAAQHPDQVKAAVTDALAVKQAIDAAKAAKG